MHTIILASGSSTRAQILRDAGVDFEQKTSPFDEESLNIQVPRHFVYHATMGKTRAFIEQNSLDIPVVCADTVVTAHGHLLRKARDKDDARNILLAQSGSVVSILTCMTYTSKDLQCIDLSATDYVFGEFDLNALEVYLSTDEWKGKAGACMVEGFCKDYIQEVRGFESTAMGLCIEKLLPFLEKN